MTIVMSVTTMVYMRPDIEFTVGAINRYMSNPRKEQWATMKWILMYLKSTSGMLFRYGVGLLIKRTLGNNEVDTQVLQRPHWGCSLMVLVNLCSMVLWS